MKRHILLFALLLCSAGRIGAQDSGSNWIKTRTAISETGTAITDITYYNGLGLPSQTANVRASVNGYNIVTPIVYDALLRSDATAYLPYEATYSDETELPNSTAVSEQQTFYEERYGHDYQRSFTEKVYEASPLGRVRKQALPGYMKDFEVVYTEFGYRTNDTDEVRRLSVNGSGELVCEGCHDAGTLSCSVTTDPDGHVVQSFTDGLGRTLLSRTFDDDEPIDTYSVYDDYGRLRWVVTPEGSYLLSDSQTFAANDDFAEKYCYVYTYDERGRTVEKQLPGCEAEYMVYDPGDRLIMSQDGNLRSQDQWIVYCYDDFGRLTEQRLGTVPDSAGGLTGAFENNPLFLYMTFTNDPTVPLLRSCTYDSYPPEVQAAGIGFQPIEGLTSEDGVSLRYENAQGHMTYEKLAVLADGAISGYHERAYYYDYRGRVIQTVERDAEEGILCTSQRYDFIGNLLAQQERYSNVNSAIDDCIDRTFTYDDRSRLLSETTQVNDGEEAVVTYSYDALGQLSGKTYGTGTSAIHETIAYTIQGWQTAKSSELFDMTLGFYDTEKPSYTGNITSWQWQHKGDPSGNGPQNRYVFTYDDLSRLTNTDQYVNNEKTRQNVERCLSYDRNGNLLTMVRYENGEEQCNFSYTYEGNCLMSYLTDKIIDLELGAHEINPLPRSWPPFIIETPLPMYEYDANGNIVEDYIRGFDLSYNQLNLLENVTSDNATVANYSYLWDGTKLSAKTGEGTGLAYRGSFSYHCGEDFPTIEAFESTSFGGGRIVATEENPEVQYFLTDHLGSVRVVATDKDNVLERNDFQPFGKRWNTASMPVADNRDRFNGKEDQAFVGLPFSDYGARMYDPERGRWFTQDPKAEDYLSVSQYAFCGNNPIKRIDWNGKEWYSYQEKYEDENGELRTRTSYKFVKGRMSEQEMQEGGYTYLGATYITDDTYYGQWGAEIPIITNTFNDDKNTEQPTKGSKFIKGLKSISGIGGTIATGASLYDKPLTLGSKYIIINEGGTIVHNMNRIYTSTGKIASKIGNGFFYGTLLFDTSSMILGDQSIGETVGSMAFNTAIWKIGTKSPQTALVLGLGAMIFTPIRHVVLEYKSPMLITPDNTRIIKPLPIH